MNICTIGSHIDRHIILNHKSYASTNNFKHIIAKNHAVLRSIKEPSIVLSKYCCFTSRIHVTVPEHTTHKIIFSDILDLPLNLHNFISLDNMWFAALYNMYKSSKLNSVAEFFARFTDTDHYQLIGKKPFSTTYNKSPTKNTNIIDFRNIDRNSFIDKVCEINTNKLGVI